MGWLTSAPWPDPDEAQDLIDKELSDPRYAQAEPTWWDKLVSGIVDFLSSLFNPEAANAAGPVLLWVAIAVIVILAVLAVIVWGRPRANLTSLASTVTLFASDDPRSAAELRAAADSHARNGEWNIAITVLVRAVARSLNERGIVVLPPGATVQSFAVDAAESFPQEREPIQNMARAFDNVRYLRIQESSTAFAQILALDARLQSQRPARLSALPSVGARA